MSEFDELEGPLSEQAEEAFDPRIGTYDRHPAEVNHDGARDWAKSGGNVLEVRGPW